LLGDSRIFDFSPWARTIDLVLVDGGHDFEMALAHTFSAQWLLALGGVMVWDDHVLARSRSRYRRDVAVHVVSVRERGFLL
jgi:hypothetical protein